MHAESDEESDERSEVSRTAAPEPPVGEVVRSRRQFGSLAPAFIRASSVLRVSWRAGIFLVGLAVIVAGIVMLPLPGPGWLVIFFGMAVWATEFVWAQLVLHWTRRKVTVAARRALDPRVRRRNMALTTVALVILTVLVAWYVRSFGITMPWEIHG